MARTQKDKTVKPVSPSPKEDIDFKGFAFGKENYILMISGVVLIIIGFLLMMGGGSNDPNVFNEDMFNFRRLTLAPILVLAGFGVELVAIMKKPRN